jgi:hypothetical protein
MPTPVHQVQQRRPRATWIIPAALVVLLAVGAVVSLVRGALPPDLIGADGLAATVVTRR